MITIAMAIAAMAGDEIVTKNLRGGVVLVQPNAPGRGGRDDLLLIPSGNGTYRVQPLMPPPPPPAKPVYQYNPQTFSWERAK